MTVNKQVKTNTQKILFISNRVHNIFRFFFLHNHITEVKQLLWPDIHLSNFPLVQTVLFPQNQPIDPVYFVIF